MPNTIVIRRGGFFMREFPDNNNVIKQWIRSNSPDPSYTSYADRAGFTAETKPVGTYARPYDVNEKQVPLTAYLNS